MNPTRGNRERFERALRTVLSEEEVSGLLPEIDVYSRRNATAHEGILHGAEDTFGYRYPQALRPDSNWVLMVLESAARRLLERSLTEDG